MQAWYPLSASVIAAWFMLPLSGTRAEALAWVSLTGPLYAGLFAAAVATLAGRLGCRAGAWALAVVGFLTSRRIDGVQVVVAVHLPHPGWSAQRPTQEAALASSPAARLLFRGEAVTVWGLGREPGSGYDVDRRRRSRSTTEDGS